MNKKYKIIGNILIAAILITFLLYIISSFSTMGNAKISIFLLSLFIFSSTLIYLLITSDNPIIHKIRMHGKIIIDIICFIIADIELFKTFINSKNKIARIFFFFLSIMIFILMISSFLNLINQDKLSKILKNFVVYITVLFYFIFFAIGILKIIKVI